MDTRFDPNDPTLTKAFDRVRPELDAMSPDRIQPIRHDITAAIVLAMGTAPKVRALRGLVVAKFGEDAARFIDRMETTANACSWAHARHLPTLHGRDVEEMAGELSQVRSILSLEVQALIARGVVSGSALAELVGGTSYKGLYLDVVQLVAVLRSHWARAEAQTGVTGLELDRAEALATAFSTTLGENEQGALSSPTAEMRRRAYTLFVETYSEVRRQVTFLRWEIGDADDIAPPLGAGRGSSKDDEEPVAMPAPTPTNGQTPGPGMPGAPAFGPS